MIRARMNNKPYKILITCKVTRPIEVIFKCYDPTRRNSVYLKRTVPLTPGVNTIDLPFPISPRLLIIKYNYPIQILDLKKIPIQQDNAYYPTESFKMFADFAKRFSKKAGYLRKRPYFSKIGHIDYLNKIRAHETTKDRNGNIIYRKNQIIPTPARISRKSGHIEINRNDFMKYSIPIRYFILLHERGHFEGRTSDEKQADNIAFKTYLSEGFSRVEAIYALTNILNENPENINRVQNAFTTINSI